jgi:hypothetical protein
VHYPFSYPNSLLLIVHGGTCVETWFLCMQTRKNPHGIMARKKLWGVGDLLVRNDMKLDGFEGKTMVGMSTRGEVNTIKTCNLVSVGHGYFELSGFL